MWELTKSFRFDAAHAIAGTTLGHVSEEVHGHSFRAEITISGEPDPQTGMIVDLGQFERSIADVQQMLDHKLPRFIWERVQHAGRVKRVTVYRDSREEACSYFGKDAG